MAKHDDEVKHAGHSEAVKTKEAQDDTPVIPPLPENWNPDPPVVPGYETAPAGVYALQPDALEAHDARVKEAAKQAEKEKR